MKKQKYVAERETTNRLKVAKAVSRARAIRAKAAKMTPEENHLHFSLAMKIIFSEAAGG